MLFMQDHLSTYGSPIRAMLAIIPFTAGDISIDDVFYSDQQTIDRSNEDVAFFMWLASVIIMSILFNNLLVRFDYCTAFTYTFTRREKFYDFFT